MDSSPGGGTLRVGMLATVRNRRGIITAIEPFSGPDQEQHHLVALEYLDGDGAPEDWVLWEREIEPNPLEPTALPDPDRSPPLQQDEFDALVRSARWSALTPFLDPDGSEGALQRLPTTAPFHGAIQVDDFQLVPLMLALKMPRVSLLLADDVGLGKTIEAGLILMELIRRRRVRRMLIAVPASLQLQWQQEMRDKFSLTFDIVNREETHKLRRRLGMDANPWRSYSRIITSYHYLRQPDVMEQFMSASRSASGSPQLPWDVLVVDEAHNLMPSPFGDDSDLSKMLETLSPMFEHKLFLTATPHNGHTRSFTGLLERLDPVRFSQTSELSDAEKGRMEDVVIRRLKKHINQRTNPPRFCSRALTEQPIDLSEAEQDLHEAVQQFKAKVREAVRNSPKSDQQAGTFALEVLGKRMLSSTVAFAQSWQKTRSGMLQGDPADPSEVRAAERSLAEETDDDQEAESRNAVAATVIGAWLQPIASEVEAEAAAIDAALAELGLPGPPEEWASWRPKEDARFDALIELVDVFLRDGSGWREDERLIIFTEYKTTLDYLVNRLRERHKDEGVILELFGGCELGERERIRAAFNDPEDPVRILIATDTGSEGQNLQQTSRYLLHYDIPWNPSRMEQRNGRLDRHGQARDVNVFHFTSDDDADISFMAYVLSQANRIREDLGSAGEVFDAAFKRRLIEGHNETNVRNELDLGLQTAKGRAKVPTTRPEETGEDEAERLEALKAEVDLTPENLQHTLDVALGLRTSRPRLKGPDDDGHVRFETPIPPSWTDVINDTLRERIGEEELGARRLLTFDPKHYVHDIGGRPVFRPEKDTALVHLAHPVFKRALTELTRARLPGVGDGRLSPRWTVRRADVPDGADALLLLTVEEMAVNDLRETLHHWVRTFRIPISDGYLGEPLPHVPASELAASCDPIPSEDVSLARAIWLEVGVDVRDFIRDYSSELTDRLREAMEADLVRARQEEQQRFQSRQGELSHLIQQNTVERLEREIAELKRDRDYGMMLLFEGQLEEFDRSIREKEEEVARRSAHYEGLRQLLERERERVLQKVLPRRYALRSQAQVFPVTIEIRLPAGGQ